MQAVMIAIMVLRDGYSQKRRPIDLSADTGWGEPGASNSGPPIERKDTLKEG